MHLVPLRKSGVTVLILDMRRSSRSGGKKDGGAVDPLQEGGRQLRRARRRRRKKRRRRRPPLAALRPGGGLARPSVAACQEEGRIYYRKTVGGLGQRGGGGFAAAEAAAPPAGVWLRCGLGEEAVRVGNPNHPSYICSRLGLYLGRAIAPAAGPGSKASRLDQLCVTRPTRLLTDKRRIPLRSASVRTPHLFHHGIPKVLVNPRSKGITSA
jgi:hypothetical protein